MRRRRFFKWLAGLVASAPVAAFARSKPRKVIFRLGDKIVVRSLVGELGPDGRTQAVVKDFKVKIDRIVDGGDRTYTLEGLDGTFWFVMSEGVLLKSYVRHL